MSTTVKLVLITDMSNVHVILDAVEGSYQTWSIQPYEGKQSAPAPVTTQASIPLPAYKKRKPTAATVPQVLDEIENNQGLRKLLSRERGASIPEAMACTPIDFKNVWYNAIKYLISKGELEELDYKGYRNAALYRFTKREVGE